MIADAIQVIFTGPPPQQIYYIHTDQLNTPRVITNDVGQPVWTWANDDPYGNNVPNENPSALGNFTCNLRLPGQYFDLETSLHYNYFRDYDSATGRYVQSDPIGLAGGVNTFAYVTNNPLSEMDLLGLCKVDLRFKPVPIAGKLGQYHAFIVTTESDGSQSYFRGGPSGKPNWMSVYGNIVTESGPYVPGTKDWVRESAPSMRLLDNNEACGCINAKFDDILRKINDAHFFYGPLWKNSNSVAGTVLRDSGFTVGPLPVSAPRFDVQLKY